MHSPRGNASQGLVPAAIAVALWSTAPALVVLAEHIPPLQLTALCVAIAAVVTAPAARSVRRQPGGRIPLRVQLAAPVLIVGAHSCYFTALRLAPAAGVALVNYTWPVLFVLAAEILQRGRIRPLAALGTLVAFAGAALMIGPEPGSLEEDSVWPGYALAFASGICWAGFSLLASRQPAPLGDHLPRLFAVAFVWAGAGHLVLESTLWAFSPDLAVLVLLIGAGPYGLAFVAWDRALRDGHSATVGTLAYAVPVLSAALLVIAGIATLEWRLPVAAIAVALGCLLASPRA